MPQPITKLVPDPHVIIDTNVLAQKPDFAILVVRIFAVWAAIERDLSVLLVRLLGARRREALYKRRRMPRPWTWWRARRRRSPSSG